MKKGLIIGLTALMVLGLATMGMAVDLKVDGTGVTSATVDFSVDNGWIDIVARGIDASTWHPGTLGNENCFLGGGWFEGTYSVSQGLYGELAARINTDSKSPASFELWDYQDFNVMSGNHTYNVEGYFYAKASGTTTPVAMNLKTAGSMYVWSEATNPYWKDALRGNYIEKYSRVEVGDVTQVELDIWVNTDGSAMMSNSDIWGWGTWESGTTSTHYSGATRNISATGSGTGSQSGWGANIFNYSNDYTFPGGGGVNPGGGFWFNDGISGTYSMDGS